MLHNADLGIVLISSSHAHAHAAFLIAAGAAALDRSVVIFATGGGVRALCSDWSGLSDAGNDTVLRERGVAGLDELRNACRDLGVYLLACPSGLRGASVTPGELLNGVSRDGVARFLEVTARAQLLSL